MDSFPPVPFPPFCDEISDHYTGTLRCLALFPAPRPHTSLQRTHVCTPPYLSVSPLGLWLSSALVVTYHCLITCLGSLSYSFLFRSCFSPQSWVIIRVFGSVCARSSKLFSFPRVCFLTLDVLDEKPERDPV